MKVVAVVGALLLTLLAVIVGMAKVQGLPASQQVRDQAKISAAVWVGSGWVELVAAAGLVLGIFVRLEVALVGATVLLISYLVLAVRQISQHQPFASVVPALGLSLLAAVTVASIAASG